ncbi:hypothetical protein Tco_0464973 [Tanacetum coccineum]
MRDIRILRWLASMNGGGGEGYGAKPRHEAAGWESIAETRNLEEFELEASKEVRKNWIEKDRCKSDMLKCSILDITVQA